MTPVMLGGEWATPDETAADWIPSRTFKNWWWVIIPLPTSPYYRSHDPRMWLAFESEITIETSEVPGRLMRPRLSMGW